MLPERRCGPWLKLTICRRVNVNPDLYRLKGRNLGRVPRPELPKTGQTRYPGG
jgi:hypothetical protein